MRLLALLFASLLLAAPARADCYYSAPSAATCTGQVNHVATLIGTIASTDCSFDDLTSSASYDAATGALYAEARTSGRHTYNEVARSVLDDEYVVSGIPVGTHLQVTAVADCELDNIVIAGRGVLPSYVGLWVPPVTGGAVPNADNFPFIASAPGEETTTHQLHLSLPVVAGTQLELQTEAYAQCSGGVGGYARAKLSFQGLPPGSTVTSCQGYRQDQPVPTLTRSWGSVKATYR